MSEGDKTSDKNPGTIINVYGDVGAIGPGAQGAVHKGTSAQSETFSKSKAQWTEEGEQHLAAGRFKEALECYERALAQDGRYSQALRGKAQALNGLSQPLDALAVVNEAIRLEPEDAVAHYIRGLILTALRRYEDALRALDEAIRLYPGYGLAYSAKVQALDSLNQHLPVGTLLLTLRGHSEFVRSVAWSPDGRFLASASNDDTVRLWNSISGQSLTTLTGHRNDVSWWRGLLMVVVSPPLAMIRRYASGMSLVGSFTLLSRVTLIM